MPAVLMPQGKQYYETSAGIPLVAGKVYTYDAGTSNPRPTYQDADATAPNTNPVILDARGEATIFWIGAYKVVLKDALDNIVWTVDRIVDPLTEANSLRSDLAGTTDPSKGDALIGVKQPFTGAVARTQHAKNADIVSVKDFGAVGDGVADDTVAIQAALFAGANIVHVPTGAYLIASKLFIPAGVALVGDLTGIGAAATRGAVLLATDSLADFILENYSLSAAPADPWWHSGRVENIHFWGNPALKTASGFNAGPCGDMSAIRNCKFTGFSVGLKIGGTGPNQGSQVSCNIDTVSFHSSNKGLHFQNCSFTAAVRNLMADNCLKPIHAQDCGNTFHCIFDQIHGENFPVATGTQELFHIDNCTGFFEFRGGAVESATAAATFAYVRVTRSTAPNKARVVIEGVHLTNANQFVLNDEDLVVTWTQAELGLTNSAVTHNMPTVLSSGQGNTMHGANFVRNAKRAGVSTIYRIESGDGNNSHNLHYFSTGGAGGIQFKDGLTPFTTYAQFRTGGTVSQWNLFTDTSGFNSGALTAGSFMEANNNDLLIGNRVAGKLGFWTNNTERCAVDSAGMLRPQIDNTYSLGTAPLKWSVVYSNTGAINTSDARQKQQVRDLSEAENAVALRLKRLIRTFRFNDAVAAKGNGARIHVGVLAQDVAAAFDAEGLDASAYGMFCYDEWAEQPEVTATVTDDDGIETTVVTSPYRPAGNLYGVRYEELLAFIVSAL